MIQSSMSVTLGALSRAHVLVAYLKFAVSKGASCSVISSMFHAPTLALFISPAGHQSMPSEESSQISSCRQTLWNVRIPNFSALIWRNVLPRFLALVMTRHGEIPGMTQRG